MTLTQAAILTKRGIIAFIIFIILGVSGVVGYNIWYQHYLANLPPVEEKPEMKFGTLPKIEFPNSAVSSSNFSYSLDTVTGGVPQTPKTIKVYFIPTLSVSLLAPDKAKGLAASFSFNSQPKPVSDTIYKFNDENLGQLTIDLSTGNFNFQKNATSSAALAQNLPDQNKLVADFKKYLAERNLLPANLQNGRSKVTFSNTQASDSDTATISLWPTDLDKLPIITANFKDGLVKTTVSRAEKENDKYLQLNYIVWTIDETTFSTYPLKSAEQALADLRSGLGYVVMEPIKAQVSISSIYLAYLEQEKYSPYLQPIFVFEGPEFTALVPAI